jgi:hypothetical protein
MKRRLTVSLLWLTKIPVAAWRTGRCDDVLPSDIWQAPGLAELKAGAAAAEKARLLVGAKTQREGDYIAAIETFFRDANQLDHRTRALAYEKANVQRSPEEFIERSSQHIPERYRHTVRSFGLFAPRAMAQTSDTVFAILGQELRTRPKPRRWAESIKRDFGRDPLLDSKGNRMTWVRRLAPRSSC